VANSDPSQDKTTHDAWITPIAGSGSGASAAGSVEGQSITVPEGYTAQKDWNGWITTWDQDDFIKPGWNAGESAAPSFEANPPSAFITVGDSQNDPNGSGDAQNLAANTRSAVSKPISGALSGRRTGVLPITVLAANYGMMSVQVRVVCDREADGALLKWQRESYETIRAAYFEMLRAHEE